MSDFCLTIPLRQPEKRKKFKRAFKILPGCQELQFDDIIGKELLYHE